MKKLLMLKGLPGSGKSTYAKSLVDEGWVRVNKDDLRSLLHNGKWSKSNENLIIEVRNSIITSALKSGKSVVVDDTNFAPHHERVLFELSKQLECSFEVKFIDTDVEICIKNDLKRLKSVGEKLIREMWRTYIALPSTNIKGIGPNAVIFDIDGTLAIRGTRHHFDWNKVGLDAPNTEVINLLNMFKSQGYQVLIFSGRDSVCYDQTQQWLEENNINFDLLLMRKSGDNRKDSIIKRELFDSIKNNYSIQYVVDDRLQVCRMWHELGLTLLKVGDPDLEF